MIRIIISAAAVVLLAAAASALIDPAIVRAVVEHIATGLQDLVKIGERLGQSTAGQQFAGQFGELVKSATQ